MTFIENIKFDIKERKSSFLKEILAGISSFLSLSYIFIVNPSILGEAGMNPDTVLFATIVASGFATIIMGLYARLPFVLAPGLEMNAYVAFVAVAGFGLSWQEGLGAVFWSGILFIIVTWFGIREQLINSIPIKLKHALAFTVGAFVLTIGLYLSGVIEYDKSFNLQNLGDLTNAKAITLYIGLATIIILSYLKIPGFILLGIILASLYANYNGLITPFKDNSSIDTSFLALDIFSTSTSMITVIVILFLVDFFGSLAKFIGMTTGTEITEKDKSGNEIVPRTRQALEIDGSATIFGSLLGTTSITTYVESSIGIAEGGRTGLVAIVAGILMLCVIPLMPYIHYIPVVATSGALIYVGYMLIPNKNILSSYNKYDYIVFGIMGLLTIFTFSLDYAMMIGFLYYGFMSYKENDKINWMLLISVILLFIGRVLQWVN